MFGRAGDRRYIRAHETYLDPEFLTLIATPGFLPSHFASIFAWSRNVKTAVRCIDRSAWLEAGLSNASSITVEDGLRIMELVLAGGRKPIVPYWSLLAFREYTTRELADRFLVRKFEVLQWKSVTYWGLGGVWTGYELRNWPESGPR